MEKNEREREKLKKGRNIKRNKQTNIATQNAEKKKEMASMHGK